LTDRDRLETDLAAFYDQQAPRRLARGGAGSWRDAAREAFLVQLRAEDRASLVEIGTGAGHDAAAFQAAGLTVAGIDLSPEHVRICRERGLDARLASVFELPFDDRAFEAGWTMSTLLHVPNDRIDAALDEIVRVLVPGAPLAIGLWAGPDEEAINEDDEIEPKRFFSRRSDGRLREILERHGAIERFETWEVPDTEWPYQFAVVRMPYRRGPAAVDTVHAGERPRPPIGRPSGRAGDRSPG
jgi:SAM-dependent methyltransferase